MNSLEVLKRAEKEERLTHAYLAPVRPGTDLNRYAADLGRTILCSSGGDECGRKVLRGTHPDFHWLTPNNDKRKISIDQVEEVISSSSYSPQEAGRKVYAIGRAEDLSREAANSLLKILEDPPDFVYFLLLTGNPDNLLPTILSRCQGLPKGGTDPEGLKRSLAGEDFSEEEAEYLAEAANGRADLLDRLLEDGVGDPLARREEILADYEDRGLGELGEILVGSEDLIEKEVLSRLIYRSLENAGRYEVLRLSDELKDLAREELSWFLERGLFIYREGYRNGLEAGNGGGVDLEEGCLEKVELVAEALESLKTNANVQLLVESLCLQLASGIARFN